MAEKNIHVTCHQMQAIQERLDHLRELCSENPNQEAILQALDGLETLLPDTQPADSQNLSAQMSLYPLRQKSLSPAITEALSVLSGYGLQVVPGSMSSILIGPTDDLFAALQEVYTRAAAKGDVVMVLTLSNACPAPAADEEEWGLVNGEWGFGIRY